MCVVVVVCVCVCSGGGGGNSPGPYMTTGKIIALTIQTFVGKVMSLLFNALSRFVCHGFSSKEQVSFNFMAAVTIHSDFGA